MRASNPSARIWAVFEPRSASSCRRVFQDDFARAFAGADEVLIAPVFRSKLAEAERLSIPQLVRDLNDRGQRAREAASIDEIIQAIAREHRPGDLVVLMSNGGFGGIHRSSCRRWRECPADRPGRRLGAGVEFDERIDPVVNARTVAFADAIHAANIPGVRDVARRSDRSRSPIRCARRTMLMAALEEHAARPAADAAADRDPIRIPVCYGGELGPDLANVAAFAKLSEADVVELHAATTYRVFMLGFVAGFAYMGIVDDRIAVPRHSTPRVRVPLGTVGIAGVQTGIYPAETPGGWSLIGRCPVRPYDATRPEPFLFHPGDRVRFRRISESAYRETSQWSDV
jgi:KipI family sensor histidine kinase inhibitor